MARLTIKDARRAVEWVQRDTGDNRYVLNTDACGYRLNRRLLDGGEQNVSPRLPTAATFIEWVQAFRAGMTAARDVARTDAYEAEWFDECDPTRAALMRAVATAESPDARREAIAVHDDYVKDRRAKGLPVREWEIRRAAGEAAEVNGNE